MDERAPAGPVGAGRPADELYMREALAFARISYAEQEIPVGAVVVAGGRIVGRGRNRREAFADPTHHAEIEALREAGQAAGTWRLDGATLYATLEPCAMCAGAAVNARLARVVFGCADPKAGYCGTLGNIPQDPRLNHRCAVDGGILAGVCAALLQQFFRARRLSQGFGRGIRFANGGRESASLGKKGAPDP